MATAALARETANFRDVNNRLDEFLARYKQLYELFGKTDGLTEPVEYSAGGIALGGQVSLVLNMPDEFLVNTYKGDGSTFKATHRQGLHKGHRTYDSYDQKRPFEAHQLQGEIETDGNYNVTSSLTLTGHMSDSLDSPGNRTMRSVSITSIEQLGSHVFFLTRHDRHT